MKIELGPRDLAIGSLESNDPIDCYSFKMEVYKAILSAEKVIYKDGKISVVIKNRYGN